MGGSEDLDTAPYELIEDTTLTEEGKIRIYDTPQGVPYQFRKMRVRVYVPQAPSNENSYIRIYYDKSTSNPYLYLCAKRYQMNVRSSSAPRLIEFVVHNNNGRWNIDLLALDKTSTGSLYPQPYTNCASRDADSGGYYSDDALISLHPYIKGFGIEANFPVGTRYVVEAIR